MGFFFFLFAVSLTQSFYSAAAFVRDTFKNYFTISFYIVQPYYWIGIFGRL